MRTKKIKHVKISITIPFAIRHAIDLKRESDPDFIVSNVCANALREATRDV